MTPRYFCHYCQVHVRIPSYLTLPTCPYCHTQFVEEEYSDLGAASGSLAENDSWLALHEHNDDDDGQDEWHDPWYLDFLPTRGDRPEQDDDDDIPWFLANDRQENASVTSWTTENEPDDNKSEVDSNNEDDQQWVTDEEESTMLSIPDSLPSDNSVAASTSSFLAQSTENQQQSSISNRRLFRIERFLDMIYLGYSESDNELDDTHYNHGFMDNLMDIFSDPMETPQTSNNSDIEQCIERLSKRTLLHGDAGVQQECTICQEPFGASIEITQMPCQHEYHSPCLSQWLFVNATCPICRCPASSIIERTPPPLPSLPSSIVQRTNRRYSYPILPEDFQDDQEQDDDDLSEYYEATDPPPPWARSSSATTYPSSSRLVYHHIHDC